MKPEYKQKWIEALRSGEYKQTTSFLCRDGGFCCLGVLCDIVDPNGWGNRPGSFNVFHLNYGTLPSQFVMDHVEEHGLTTRQFYLEKITMRDPELYAAIGHANVATLPTMNDTLGFTFEQIADILEDQL